MNDVDGSDRLGTFSTVAGPSASDISTCNTVDGSHVSHTSNHFSTTAILFKDGFDDQGNVGLC
jgi:hypothetical protein